MAIAPPVPATTAAYPVTAPSTQLQRQVVTGDGTTRITLAALAADSGIPITAILRFNNSSVLNRLAVRDPIPAGVRVILPDAVWRSWAAQRFVRPS